MRLVLVEGRNYTVYEGRKVVARLFDTEHYGVPPEEVEAARVADYPQTQPERKT